MKQFEAQFRSWIERAKVLVKDEKRRVNLLVAIGALGLLLLALSEWLPASPDSDPSEVQSVPEANQQDYAGQLESRLQALIAQVDGAGTVEVMVTLESGEESIYATDRETSADGSASVSHVLLNDQGLIETTQAPQVLGVAVVCEGGDDAAVQNRISTLVEVLTGVGANHVTVTKMAASN